MSTILITGRRIYSAGVIALATLCIINKDFIIGRPPGPLNDWLAYSAAILVLISAVMIFFQKKVKEAALVIALLIVALSVSRHLPVFMNDWGNAYKTLALFGGTLLVAASGTGNNNMRNYFIWTGIILLCAFLLACGYAHIKFYGFVKEFIPAYIPFRGFFAYFTAACLISGGIGICLPFTRKLAAVLTGIMLLGWFFLLHIPRFVMDTSNASDRLGLCESFTFAGIFFVLAALSSKPK
jgi:uncharacterized membrane protein YphA (DoxX/SURF4 family)